MKIINDFKKHIQGIKASLADIRGKIADTNAKIRALESAPLPPEAMPAVLSAMVDSGAKRYLTWLQKTGLEQTATFPSISVLASRIEEKSILDPLFTKSGKGGATVPDPDAFCFFFGDILKERFAIACAGYTAKVPMDETIVSPMDQRLQEIAAAHAEVKDLELQEEDVEAAMDDARVQIESLPSL